MMETPRSARACAALALGALLAAASAGAAQGPVSDFYGTWGRQDSDKNKNEWRQNCAAPNGDVLILSPDLVTTRGATWIYKDYPECKVINASGGAQLLIRAQCYSDPQEAEDVTLQYDILSETEPLRIQLRGQVSTEYLKCP
jgi:hypothetical protein